MNICMNLVSKRGLGEVSQTARCSQMVRRMTEARCRDGVTCVVFVCPALPACTLPSLYLVSVVFGMTIPTSLYILGKCFSHF